MDTLSTVLRYEMFFVLTALAVIIAYRLLTRQINTKGLLRDKVGGRAISPGRLQLFIVTLLIAIYYVEQVFQMQKLPNLPHEYLLALGGSHLFYLGGKFYGLLASKLEIAVTRIVERSTKIVNGG
jgi:hypothetical protein